jgi:hypothetical protein
MTTIKKILCVAAIASVFTACKKDDPIVTPTKTPLVIPTVYSSTNFAANVTTEASVRNQMNALTSYMKRGENVANKLNIDSLNKYFANNGIPSLSAITQPYYKNLITTGWFQTMVDCSQNAYDPANGATATNGGVFGARLLDKKGKENLQEIEKGMFEATMYSHFITLTQGTITAETVDKMISIYGAHPNFPNTNTAANTPTPDGFIALYAARRDKNDGNGFYTKTKAQFLKLQAAVAAGVNYNQERDEAIAEIKLLMEKALMATVVHYGFTAITKLSTTSPPATTLSSGLHDLGEAVGFTHGFKAIAAAQRKITDTQIDEVLSLLLAPSNADASMYKFVTNGTTELAKITLAQQKIKAIYGFTETEMDEFKNNWISVQAR